MRSTYFGNDGGNYFSATATIRESFYGLDGEDTFHVYASDFSDRFFGGRGADRMEGMSISYDGASGLDAYGLLSFDGGGGYDTLAFAVDIAMADYTDTTATLALDDVTTLARSVEHREFDVSLSEISDTVADLLLNGGASDETLRLTQTAQMADGGALTVDLGRGDDYFEFSASSSVSSDLTVLTRGGSDTVIIGAATSYYPGGLTTVVKTGAGADVIVLEGMYKEIANAGGGDDEIYVLTGGFAGRPDTIRTGAGADKVFLELDAYSKIAKFRDFSAAEDTIVFDASEFRDTEVTFDKSVWEAAAEDKLYMDNDAGKLYFGDNVLASFGGAIELTAENFTTDVWAF